MTSAPFVAVPSKILHDRIGFDGMSKEYVTIFKTKEDGLIASDRLIVVMSEDEMKAACPKFLQRGTTKEENAPLPIHEILVKDDSSRKESDEFTSTMNTELVKDIEAVNSLQLLVDSAPKDERCTKYENASKGDCPGKESDLLTDNMNVELRQDVERAVKRLRLLLDSAPSPNTDKFLSKHLAILNEYSSMSCISACFLECGAVEVLIKILNRTSTSHCRLQQSAGSVLFHLTGSRTDKSVGTEILGQIIREATLNKGEKVKSRLAKQDIVFKIFGHLHPNDPNLELMTNLPCVTSSFAYSLVKDYISCLLISEKVMRHSQGLFPPLLVPGSSELLPLKDVQESVDLKSSFALFGLLSRVILRMVKILNWRRPEDQRVAARRRTSILSISRKSARRKNVYKSRKNFTTDQEYSDYVKSTLKPGMSVICIQAYVNVHIGYIGKFISANTYYPPLTIKWDSLGTNVGVPYGSVQILPNYSQEAVSKEDKARNMTREVSSLNLQDSGFSTSQERLTLQHWWEVLCAVQELPVEKQSKVCGMLKVKEFEDLLSVQPTMMEVCAVLKYLKMHHPEGMWREFSVQMLSSYWTVSQERSPHEVARVFEEEWGQGMKSVVSIDRFFTSRMVEDSDRFLVINIITAQYNGRGGYHPDWVIQNVLDFIYRYHGGSVTRMADMRSALLSACVDNCRLSIATNLFISSNAFSKIQITEVFIAFWIMKLIVSRNSNQLDKMASSGSFSFVLYLIEMSKGSPLMQCYGLLCIHAHFANCKSRELLWINNSSIHGRKMRSQKKPSPVEPLIAELARCTGEPTQGHRSTLSQLEAHSGSLKSFLEAVGDVTRSSKGSGLPWQKSFFRSGVENSLHVLNALVQRGGKMVVARLMAWGFLSVVKEVFEVFPGVDARFALETAMKQLCETTNSDPNAKKRRTENCPTSTVRKNNEFDDFLYAFVNGALDVKYIGEIMKFLTVHLGVTGSSTDKPCVVKTATVANKDRARMFVTNGGTVRLLEMVCGGSVSPLDAKMVLQLIVALLNISEEVCDEIVNHGLVRALLILMESLCKTAHLVACYVLCIIHKLATNNEYLLVMKDEAMTTSLKDMKKSRPEYESSITTLCTTISSVGFMVQENCTESAACVLLELNKAIVNTLANSRIARDVPAIPHLSSYLTVLTEGNESLHTLSQGRCWYLMEVSDCDYAKNQLLDNNPSTFWESYQSHWIKLYMHTGCIIRKLTVDVSNSDRRYMPKTITVEGGGSGQLKELSTVSIPLEANGTFVLLEDQTESYSVIRVCVKESHSGLNEVRLRGLHCTCLSLSMWPQFVSSLRTGMQVSSSISVSTWMKKKLDPLELYDRMFAALVHQQKVADAYFLTSMAREELGQICRQTLIKPTIEGILRGQGEGSIEEALEAYISSTDVPVNCALAFFSWSASHSQPSMLPQLPSSSLMEQDGEMKRMSRIRQLCRVLFECILSLSNSDSDSAHASAKDCFRILEKFWCNVVSNQLRPAFLKISSRPNSLGESVSEYMRVVDKLRMIVCELFSGDARLLNRLYAVSCGRFPAPVAMEDIIRFHVAVNTHLNALLECPATSESDATLSQLATQLLGAGDEAMKMFECTYRYFLCQRLLQGKSSSLSLEKSHLSSFSNVCRENLCQKVLRDVERSIELAEAFSMSAPHGPVDTSPLQWSNVCESALAPSVVEEQRRRALYRQGVLSVLVLTPLFWPVKFLQVNDPVYLPNPLRSFCKDYQQFFTHSYSRRVTSHERPPKLKWTLSGWAIVDHNGQLYKVSTAQLIVLLQFNSKDAVTSSTLVASAGFSSELFDRVIRSLVVGPVPLLREAPHSSIESSTYSLNPVACARTRQSSSVVNVAHEDDGDVGMTAIVGHNSSVIAKSFKSREATLDCAVIQVMKEEKRATVDTVISKVLQSVREGTLSDAGDKFECSHGNVFGRIEHLVSVGYLQYDDNLSHVIVYSEEFNERRNPAVTISGQKYSGQKRKSMMGRGSPCVKRRKSAFSSSSSSCMPSLPLWFLPTPGVSIAGNYNQSRIQLYISTIVEEVAEALVLEAYEAEILLHHCKWNKDRLLHLSSSDYKLTSLLAEAGLTCSEDVPLASSSENGCPVCLRPLLEPLSLDCNHNCCRDCWMGHLTSQFSFSQILNAKCPIPKCNLTCTSCFVDTVFDNDQEISTKFKNALVASFIDHSEDFKWCSNPKGCSSIVRKTPGHISGPCQTCGWVSCFKCSFMEGHEPATCSDMVTWVQGGGYYKYMSEEQKSRQLEMLISKKCPKCYVSIEKNDGCLHMMCRCGHDFCWRCLKPWKPLHKDYYRCTIAISREAVKHHKLSEYNAKCTELLKSSEQMLELKDNVEITHAVSGVPLAQFNFMLDACSVLASSYKMLAYAYVADYYKSASDQWDCLPILSQSMSKEARLLQGFLDIVLCEGKDVARISEVHLNEGRQLVRNLERTKEKILLGAKQRYALSEDVMPRAGLNTSNTSAQGRNLYGSSTEREKTPESSSFPVEAFFDTNAAGVSSHFGLLPSVLSMSQSKPQPTSSGTETIPAVLSEEDDVDTIYDDDDDDDMDSEYSDLYAEDYMCVCGQCN